MQIAGLIIGLFLTEIAVALFFSKMNVKKAEKRLEAKIAERKEKK